MTTPTRIQLRLLSHQGHALTHAWAQVQPHVHAPQAQLGAQDLTLALPMALLGGPALASLVWSGAGWVLNNHSTQLYVYINQQVLAPGQGQHIDVDDVLEVGLSRFVVETADQVWQIDPIASADKHKDTQPSHATATPLWDALHATTTATLGDTGKDNPFDLVPLLDLPPQPTAPQASRGSPATTAPLAGHTHGAAPAAPAPAAPAFDDELSELGNAYLQALHDPLASLYQGDFAPYQATPEPGVIRDFEKEAQQSDRPLSLEEIIQNPPRVEVLLDRFHAPQGDDLYDKEPHDNILWLFAPEAERKNAPTRPALAPRTRQDHHSMALDSSYHLHAPIVAPMGDNP